MKNVYLSVTLNELEKVRDAIEYGEVPYIGTYIYKINDNNYEFSSFGEQPEEFVNLYKEQLDKIIGDNFDKKIIKIKLKDVGDNWEIQ